LLPGSSRIFQVVEIRLLFLSVPSAQVEFSLPDFHYPALIKQKAARLAFTAAI
jgi:hypothetical protein